VQADCKPAAEQQSTDLSTAIVARPPCVRVGRHDPIVPRPLCPERQTCARTSQLAREVPFSDSQLWRAMRVALRGQRLYAYLQSQRVASSILRRQFGHPDWQAAISGNEAHCLPPLRTLKPRDGRRIRAATRASQVTIRDPRR
jgi:hypothetical protein